MPEETPYRIKLDLKQNNLLLKYTEDMYKLSPDTRPLDYIALHDRLLGLKDVVKKQHLDIYKYVCEKLPNIDINFEARIKSRASALEKSYIKTEEAISNNTFDPSNPPILYDLYACRFIINFVEFKIEQAGKFFDETSKAKTPYYAFRSKGTPPIKICIGDCIDVGNNQVITVTKNNLICNPNGTLSIVNEQGDSFSLLNRTIQKRDRNIPKQACYDVKNALVGYLQKEGYICLKERDKDYIANPKYKLDLRRNNDINKKLVASKKMSKKMEYLDKHEDKINYHRSSNLSKYQSLHYGVYDPEYDYYCEFQIRDSYMHEIAEHDAQVGHDAYKKMSVDASAPYRIFTSYNCKKNNTNGAIEYEIEDVNDDILYEKIFSMSKEEVFKEIARIKKQQLELDNNEAQEH